MHIITEKEVSAIMRDIYVTHIPMLGEESCMHLPQQKLLLNIYERRKTFDGKREAYTRHAGRHRPNGHAVIF